MKVFFPLELLQSSNGEVGVAWEKGVPVRRLNWAPARDALAYYRRLHPSTDVYILVLQQHYEAPPDISPFTLYVPSLGESWEGRGFHVLRWTLTMAKKFQAPFIFNGELQEIKKRQMDLDAGLLLWWEKNQELQIRCQFFGGNYVPFRDLPLDNF